MSEGITIRWEDLCHWIEKMIKDNGMRRLTIQQMSDEIGRMADVPPETKSFFEIIAGCCKEK